MKLTEIKEIVTKARKRAQHAWDSGKTIDEDISSGGWMEFQIDMTSGNGASITLEVWDDVTHYYSETNGWLIIWENGKNVLRRGGK